MLVEGIVDLAFEEHGAWTVVDYKTDRELAAAGEDRYRRQVALYASAIAQATGAPCGGCPARHLISRRRCQGKGSIGPALPSEARWMVRSFAVL